jgi:N-acetylmuramoyl-L-alanine amidase
MSSSPVTRRGLLRLPPLLRASALVCLLAFLCLLPRGAGAEESRTLRLGEIRKGDVATRPGPPVRVAADQIAARLGFVPDLRSDGLIVKFGGTKLELYVGASVARVAGRVTPLASPPLLEGGHLWAEAESVLPVFEAFLGAIGRPGDLSWGQAGSGSVATPPPSSSAGNVPTRVPLPSPSPRLSPAADVDASGTARLLRIRWGAQGEGLRAVLDLSGPADVEVLSSAGRLELRLAAVLDGRFSDPGSPRSELVRAQAANVGGRAVVTFLHGAGTVRPLRLHKPERFAVDFLPGGNGGVLPVATGPVPPPRPTAAPTVPVPSPAGPGIPSVAPEEPLPSSPPPEAVFRGNKRPIVIVDPGHGGHDPGAMANGLREKDINLAAARRLVARLSAYGVDARFTRSEDRFWKLSERTEYANRVRADLFISLHCNALPAGRHSQGIEIYLMALPTDKDAMRLAVIENREPGGSADTEAASDRKTRLLMKILGDMQQNAKIGDSTELAEVLFRQGKASRLPMKRVAQAPFYVLRGSAMPSVLVEMGFLTEASEARLLNSPEYQEKIAAALAAGIVEYLRR